MNLVLLNDSHHYRSYSKNDDVAEYLYASSNSPKAIIAYWRFTTERNLLKYRSYRTDSYPLARALSFFYTLENGKPIAAGSWKDYLEIFEDRITLRALEKAKEQYDYPQDVSQIRQAVKLSRQWDHINLELLLDGWDENRIGYYPQENMRYELDTIENQRIWTVAYSIGGGNPFYLAAVRKHYEPYQCTTFAWFRFWQVYGYDSGADGNGRFNAAEIVADHPFEFALTNYPAAGATFSKQPYYERGAGHVGFIEAMDDKYIWFSDGNSDVNGLVRLNWKMSLDEFWRYVGRNCQFAVPIDLP